MMIMKPTAFTQSVLEWFHFFFFNFPPLYHTPKSMRSAAKMLFIWVGLRA